MSYSFNIQADSKGNAYEKIAAEWDKIVTSQPCHLADLQPARAAAYAFVGLLTEPSDEQIISVTCSGYLGWTQLDPEAGQFTGSNMSVSASISTKPPAA